MNDVIITVTIGVCMVILLLVMLWVQTRVIKNLQKQLDHASGQWGEYESAYWELWHAQNPTELTLARRAREENLHYAHYNKFQDDFNAGLKARRVAKFGEHTTKQPWDNL